MGVVPLHPGQHVGRGVQEHIGELDVGEDRACLEREVAARQSNGGEIRIRAARLPARKTLEEFDFDHQRSLKRDVIAHLGALDFVEAKENMISSDRRGQGRPTWPSGCPSGPAILLGRPVTRLIHPCFGARSLREDIPDRR